VRARDTLAWSPWPRLVGPAPYGTAKLLLRAHSRTGACHQTATRAGVERCRPRPSCS